MRIEPPCLAEEENSQTKNYSFLEDFYCTVVQTVLAIFYKC